MGSVIRLAYLMNVVRSDCAINSSPNLKSWVYVTHVALSSKVISKQQYKENKRKFVTFNADWFKTQEFINHFYFIKRLRYEDK